MAKHKQYQELETLKNKIVNNTILVGASIGFLGYLAANFRFDNEDLFFSYVVELILYAAIGTLYFFRKKVPLKIKTIVILVVLLAFVIIDTYFWGPFSLMVILVVIIPLYASIIFTFRQSLMFFVISMVAYIGISLLHSSEVIEVQLSSIDWFRNRASFLVVYGLLLTVISAIVVVFHKQYHNTLLKVINNLESRNRELEFREKTLEDEQSFINSMIDSMPGVFNLYKRSDSGYELVNWNKNTRHITGLSNESLFGQDPFYMVHLDHKERLANLIESVINDQRGNAVAKSRHHVNKKISRWYYFTGHPLQFAGQDYAIVTGLDISDQKEAERLFNEEKAFTLSLLDVIPGVFFLFEKDDQNFILKRWNGNLEKQTGFSPEELQEMQPSDFFSKEQEFTIKQAFDQMELNKAHTIEAPIRKKNDHGDFWFFVNKKFEQDNKEYLLGVGIDIADRKVMERELEHRNLNLKDMLDDLQSRNKKLAEYAFVNSHLLRAPLARLLGLAELVSKKATISEDAHLIESFKSSAMELDAIVSKINEVLDHRKDLKREDILEALGKYSEDTKVDMN